MADYSSYVTIQTTASVPQLTLQQNNPPSGSYDPNPPQTIAPAGTVSFQLHDPSGPRGSQGFVLYAGGGASVGIGFACPYGFQSNYANVSASGGNVVADWFGQSDGPWATNEVPLQGHPVRMFVGLRLASEPPFRAPS